MLREENWEFPIIKTEVDLKGVDMEAVYGVAKNEGTTDAAVTKILKDMTIPSLSVSTKM